MTIPEVRCVFKRKDTPSSSLLWPQRLSQICKGQSASSSDDCGPGGKAKARLAFSSDQGRRPCFRLFGCDMPTGSTETGCKNDPSKNNQCCIHLKCTNRNTASWHSNVLKHRISNSLANIKIAAHWIEFLELDYVHAEALWVSCAEWRSNTLWNENPPGHTSQWWNWFKTFATWICYMRKTKKQT